MRILTITEVFPYPPHDGTRIQIYQRVRCLSRNNDVTLLCLVTEPPSAENLAEMQRYCQCVVIKRPDFETSSGAFSRAWNVARSAWKRMPYYMIDEYSDEAERWLSENTRRGELDVIEADSATAKYLKDWQAALKIWIWHSIGSANDQRAWEVDEEWVTRARQGVYGRITRSWERRQSRSVDANVALTPDNALELQELGLSGEVWQCLSNGIDLEYFSYSAPDRDARGVCFVGKMDYKPNEDAILQFHARVWPTVKTRHPEAELYVVGSKPSAAVKALESDPSVRVTGYVEDVRPYLRRSAVAIAPLRMGGGILNKVLEAMAAGPPVVARSIALQGIAAEAGRELLAHDEDGPYAEAVCALLEDYPRRLEISRAARAYVEERHEWGAIVQTYEERLAAEVDKRREAEQMLSTAFSAADSSPGEARAETVSFRGDRPRPFKVLHLTSSGGFYGAERVIELLARTIDPATFSVSVGALEKKRSSSRALVDVLTESGVEAFVVPCGGRLDWKTVRALVERIRREDIRLLHCHEPKSRLYGVIASRVTRTPVVATHHLWVGRDLITRLSEMVDALCLHFCDCVIAVSNPIAATVRRCGIPASRIEVVLNGVDIASRATEADREFLRGKGVPDGLPLVGSVGRLEERKGHDLFLRGAQRVLDNGLDAAFVVAGEGPDREPLEALARELGIAHRVFLVGYHDRVPALYPAMDVFALCSKDEGTPMVLLEAMAAGTPSIATDVGGVGDVLEHGTNGLILQSRDPDVLATQIRHLLTDRQYARQLGDAGRLSVERVHSASAVAQRYEAIYRRVTRATPVDPTPSSTAAHALSGSSST